MMMLQALATRPAPGCAGRSLKRGGADHARPLRQQPARLAWRAAVVAPPPRCLQRVQAVRADEEANEEQPQRKYSLEGLQGCGLPVPIVRPPPFPTPRRSLRGVSGNPNPTQLAGPQVGFFFNPVTAIIIWGLGAAKCVHHPIVLELSPNRSKPTRAQCDAHAQPPNSQVLDGLSQDHLQLCDARPHWADSAVVSSAPNAFRCSPRGSRGARTPRAHATSVRVRAGPSCSWPPPPTAPSSSARRCESRRTAGGKHALLLQVRKVRTYAAVHRARRL